MVTKHDLREYRSMKLKYSALTEEYLELKSLCTSLKAQQYTDTPKGTAMHDIMLDKIESLEESKRKCNEMLTAMITKRKEIEDVIYSIKDPLEQAVLVNYYLLGYTWEKVAVKMHYTERHILRLHGDALQHVIECQY